jgi:hypothetical protein
MRAKGEYSIGIPSIEHEGLVELIRQHPALAVELLRHVETFALPYPMANSMTAVMPLPPAPIFGLLCVYALGSLAAGAWSLNRRDA